MRNLLLLLLTTQFSKIVTLLDGDARSVGGSHFYCYVLLFIIKAVAVHVVLFEQQRLIVGKV